MSLESGVISVSKGNNNSVWFEPTTAATVS